MVGYLIVLLLSFFDITYKLQLDTCWIVLYDCNFTCTGTFLTYEYIPNPTRKCHKNSHLRWE